MSKTLCTLLLTCFTLAAAHAGSPPTHHHPTPHWGHHHLIYPIHSRPFGKSIDAWAELEVQWLYAQPFDHNPLIDMTGADCAVGQHGPVWFLPPIASSAPGNFSRSCSIPHGKAILLSMAFASATWPCPDPTYAPAPGQSLHDFLLADAKSFFMFASLDVSLDGRPIRHALRHHYASENLFAFKGDPSLQSTFDSCITTKYQADVVYGYFMMFRPLKRGMHTLVRRSVGPTGATNTFTYFLNVQ